MPKRNKPTYDDLVEIIERYDKIRKSLTPLINKRWNIHTGQSMNENPSLENLKELKEIEHSIITHISNEWVHSNEDPYHELEDYEDYQVKLGKGYFNLPPNLPDEPPF